MRNHDHDYAPPPAGAAEGDLGELVASKADGEAGAVRPEDGRPRARGREAEDAVHRTGRISPTGDGLVKGARSLERLDGFVGESEVFLAMLGDLCRLAHAGFGLRAWGERGTGKELVARRYHELGPRASRPFVVLNAGQITPTLAESVLCGHERGAFTNAHALHHGVFERANGGTLFIDEVGELPLEVQPMLLRILQQREVVRLGGSRTIRVDVNVVVATNRDVQDLVARGLFRADLFDRLALPLIRVPPLRERGGQDVALLADHFAREFGKTVGAEVQLASGAYRVLVDHDWPGNVRELRNVIRAGVAHSPDLDLDRPGVVCVTADAVRAAISACCARTTGKEGHRRKDRAIEGELRADVSRRLAEGESATSIAKDLAQRGIHVSSKTVLRCRE